MVTVAVAGIAIGLAVMLLAVGIVRGYRIPSAKRSSVSGAHVRITNMAVGDELESSPMPTDGDFVPLLLQDEHIKHVQRFAVNPHHQNRGRNTRGYIQRGRQRFFDWEFFEQNLLEGTMPRYTGDSNTISNDIVVSARNRQAA